mmetsp:Transcript_21511/g.36883  ORF Transcript_21511/g.36883 Transcript_21511/m.36883 type:complete len:227 (+) Transcript_21511:1128-1808(+)
MLSGLDGPALAAGRPDLGAVPALAEAAGVRPEPPSLDLSTISRSGHSGAWDANRSISLVGPYLRPPPKSSIEFSSVKAAEASNSGSPSNENSLLSASSFRWSKSSLPSAWSKKYRSNLWSLPFALKSVIFCKTSMSRFGPKSSSSSLSRSDIVGGTFPPSWVESARLVTARGPATYSFHLSFSSRRACTLESAWPHFTSEFAILVRCPMYPSRVLFGSSLRFRSSS